ncbi:MAG: penicillin acylase family protein, partial [Dehalococcoidia bacterium]
VVGTERAGLSDESLLATAVSGPIEILRDRSGVPHVFAATTADLYFGLGFVMAEDRLWQMDRLRRRALGRQAEILGPASVTSDLAHRLVGIPEIAAAEVRLLDDGTREIVEAFAAGINRGIEGFGAELPVEFGLLGYEPEPFLPGDVIAILRGIWWSLNGRIDNLVSAEATRVLPAALRLAALTPEEPEERIVPAAASYPGAGAALDQPRPLAAGTGDLSGSNNWAVAGSRTASGQAILCSDPHQPFWLPSSWYEFGLHGPEENVAGAGHPGVPGLWWGSNGQIAWGLTNNGASTRDLYVEQVHPDDPSRYRNGERWERFGEEPVEIRVRGEGLRRFTKRTTVRGPVMNEVLPPVAEGGDPPLSLRWVGQEHLDDVRACVAIGRATDWTRFRAALRDWSVPIFNFTYADRAGTVGYQCAGRIPVRGRVKFGYREAGNPEDEWQGYVPFEGLPRMENPDRGWVASANNQVAADDFPYPLYGMSAAGYRAMRIKSEIERDGPFDAARARALQLDVKGMRPVLLAPVIAGRFEGSDDPDARTIADLMRGWDGQYALDEAAPAVFETFMRTWQERVAAERFPARLAELVAGQGGIAKRLLEGVKLDWFGGDVDEVLVETARTALGRLRERWGPSPEDWRWARVHQAHLRHPLSGEATSQVFDLGPAPIAGAGDTICNTGLGVPPEIAASSGAEYRLIVDFAEPDRFLAVQNAGNSGVPGNAHYGDQFEDWVVGRYHTVHLTRDGVEGDLEARTVLEPDMYG